MWPVAVAFVPLWGCGQRVSVVHKSTGLRPRQFAAAEAAAIWSAWDSAASRRGVDIGAKVDIYRQIGALAGERAAILVVSSDLLQLTGLADRVLVFFRGAIVAELASAETNQDRLLNAGDDRPRRRGPERPSGLTARRRRPCCGPAPSALSAS